MATPISIPDDWDDSEDSDLILFVKFCEAIRSQHRTGRDRRRRGFGPRWVACGKRAIRIKLEDLGTAPRQIPSARW